MTDSFVRSIQQQVQSWFSHAQAKATETDNGLVDLPDDAVAHIEQRLQVLSSPPAYQTAIREAIATAVTYWQQSLTAPNNLVILGSPVEPIAQIMHQSLRGWHDSPLHPQVPLSCLSRSRDPLSLTQQMKQSLEAHIPVQQHRDRSDANRLAARKTLLVIPSLDQCFLRCIGGWNSVEYLRDLSIHNRDCFWVVGCSHWAWNFLDFVCQISAYFNQIEPLPELTGEMLQEWLDPIAKTVVKPNDSDEAEGDRRRSYWNSLSNQSSGVSSIAVQLWLQSLHVQKDDLENTSLEQTQPSTESEQTSDQLPFKLYETPAVLPSLPSLTVDERYLLHSLLIHSCASYAHLALTLGEPESQIQSRIQRLLREKVLEFRDGVLSVRALHYARLKVELANNNFFVGDD